MTMTTGETLEVLPDPAPDPHRTRPPGAGRGGGVVDRLRSLGWALLGLLGFGLLWQLAAAAGDLPPPAEGLREVARMASDPFYDRGPNDKGVGRQLLISLQRVTGGFILAALVGVPLGLLMGASRRAWQAANPVVQLLRPVSPLAWFPIWLVIIGNAGRASVFVIFVTALWPTVLNTAAGAAAIPRDHRNVALVFRFGRMARLRHVLLPNALPPVVTGLRQSMGIAWMVIVAVEMLSGGAGIGGFVWESYNANSLAAMTAAILAIGGVGLALDVAFLRLGRRVALEEVRP